MTKKKRSLRNEKLKSKQSFRDGRTEERKAAPMRKVVLVTCMLQASNRQLHALTNMLVTRML